jgi:hypothetical protein
MKKFLLLIIVAAFAFSASAQQNVAIKPLQKARTISAIENEYMGPFKPLNIVESKSAIQRIPFGTSYNCYTLYGFENNNVDYNPALDMVVFTHRGGANGVSTGAGDIIGHYTTYAGTNVDSLVFPQVGNNRGRYPNGVIYNPAGNTDPANAYFIATGPITDGSGWKYNYFFSQKLDGSQLNQKYVTNVLDSFRPAYINLTACDGGKLKLGGNAYDANSVWSYFYFMSGELMNDTISWSSMSSLTKFMSTFHGRLFSNDTTDWAFNPFMAFSDDGMIGYFYCIAWELADDGINSGAKPLVWKTTDGGTNWVKMPVQDLSAFNSILSNYIKPTRKTLYDPSPVYRPYVPAGATTEEFNYPGIVDDNGDLHIFLQIDGAYSNDPDSLEYTYAYHPITFFDMYTTTSGWGLEVIDSIYSAIDETTFDRTMDHGMHMAKSADESKIFFIWTDSETDTINDIPDIRVRGFDLTAGTSSIAKTATNQMDYYFMNCASEVKETGTEYFMPCTFAVLGGTGDDGPQHMLVKGVSILTSEFVGVEENIASAINTIEMYPNPAKDYTYINLNLSRNENVQVTVTNLLGQQVYAKNYGMTFAGNNKLALNTSYLGGGVYFVTVTAGQNKVSSKLIVQ